MKLQRTYGTTLEIHFFSMSSIFVRFLSVVVEFEQHVFGLCAFEDYLVWFIFGSNNILIRRQFVFVRLKNFLFAYLQAGGG